MTELLKLRDYQSEAIYSTFEAIRLGTNRPAVVLPTGAGKTVIFSWMANQWITDGNTSRVIILVHRDELVKQTVKSLKGVAPGLRVGVVKASQNEHENVDVIVASVQTLRLQQRHSQIRNIGLVIVDEAHHASADSYRKVLDYFGCFAPKSLDCICGRQAFHTVECRQARRLTPAVGFSATLSRSDRGDLASVWQEVVCRRDILDLIPEHLCDVRGRLVTVDGLSLSDVTVRAGDLAAGSLTEALLTSDAQSFVVKSWLEHASDRPTVVFTPTVEAMHAFAAEFVKAGIPTGSVWGAQSDDDRDRTLKRYASGDIRVIVNCMVLTEGFDAPWTSCVVIARATRSAELYVQMVGRALRKHPGKYDALVLDVVGASADHRLATLVDLTSQRVREVQDGETLAEAAVREREAGNPDLSRYTVSARDVDLFHRSPSAWLRTYEGVYFLTARCQVPTGTCTAVPYDGRSRAMKCGTHVYFLWPDDEGTYSIGVRSTIRAGGRYLREKLDLETAMSWAEQIAEEEDATVSTRAASWRTKKGKPSEAQTNYALTLGLVFPETVTKPELSDMMSIHIASRMLDKAYKSLMERISA